MRPLARPLARTIRHGLLLALAAAPVGLAAYGCDGGGEPTVENLCGWLGDPNNCYRALAKDVGASCGAAAGAEPTKGQFLDRSKLEKCVFSTGGSVVFDPAPPINTFPLKSLAFTITDALGLPCMSTSIDPAGGYTVKFEPVPEGGAVGAGRQGNGGTFTASQPESRETLDVTCPSGESHHFNQLQLGKCEGYAGLMPRVEIESAPGSIQEFGFVRVRIFYPPVEGELSGASSVPVHYFDCQVPKAPVLCADEVRDQDETDVDCGGICPPCDSGKRCLVNEDCLSGDCLFDPQSGIGKCAKEELPTATSSVTTATGSGTSSSTGAGTGGGGGGATSSSTGTTGP